MSHIPPDLRIPPGGRYGDPRDSDPNWHTGIDLNAVKRVLGAPFDGVVRHRGSFSASSSYGAWVQVEAGSHWARAAHLSRILVPDGARVRAGEPIVVTGGVPGEPGSGGSTGAHVHLEDLVDGRWRDPTNRLGSWFHVAAPEPQPGGVSEMVLFRRGNEPQVWIWWGVWRQAIARDSFNRIAAGMGLSEPALFGRVLSISPPDGWHLLPTSPPGTAAPRGRPRAVSRPEDWADLVEAVPPREPEPLIEATAQTPGG